MNTFWQNSPTLLLPRLGRLAGAIPLGCLSLAIASLGPLTASAQDADGDGLPDAWERGTGRYQVVLGLFTWQQAQADAESRGGHLATVIHAAEWEDMKAVLGSAMLGKNLWLGGTDEGTEGAWRWVTGETWGFANWRPGQPNNDSLGNGRGLPENFLTVWGREVLPAEITQAYWNDVTPTGSLFARDGYILERGSWTNWQLADTDQDGLTDAQESPLTAPFHSSTDPNNPDTDKDGLSDGDEVKRYHTNPANPDTDEDGLSDGGELNTWHTDPLRSDTDRDGLSDGRELFVLRTDPLKDDTDGDGFSDGEEITAGTNPLDPKSSLVAKHREYTAVEVEFQTQIGLSYQLQTLSPTGSWEPVGSKTAGTGQPHTLLMTTREAPMRIWRVIIAK